VQNAFRRLLFHYWYLRQPPWDTGISPPELLEFIETHAAGRALDMGCGTGTNVITLARSGWRVTGVDFAPRAITLAKKKIKKEGVQAELLVSDATKLDGIPGPFDLAFDLGCFHGISQPGQAKYLDQLERSLAPNGFWLMYGFVKPEAAPSQPAVSPQRAFGPNGGLDEAAVERISARFTPLSRRNGHDTAHGRSSAWFLFQNKTDV
jgi:cyclopropane fatty-acyl-phospholipid synthase-like methyltransferase